MFFIYLNESENIFNCCSTIYILNLLSLELHQDVIFVLRLTEKLEVTV